MEEKIIHWKKITKQWRQSGVTQKEFCKSNDLKLTTLRYWIGQIKKAEDKETPLKDLVCVSIPPQVAATDIVLEVEDRYRITLSAGFNPETLRKILAVIG